MLLVLLAYIGLPSLIGVLVPRLLAERGIPASVDGAKVDLSTNHLTLYGLRLGADPGPSVRFGEVRMQISPLALLDRRLEIRTLRLREAQFDLDSFSQLGSAIQVAADDGWQVELADLQVEALTLVGATEKLGHAVSVERAVVRNIAALRTNGAEFDVRVDFGQGDLHVGGRARITEEGLSVKGKLATAGFPVSLLAPESGAQGSQGSLGPQGSEWSGVVHATLTYEIRHRADRGSVEATLAGDVRASALNVGLKLGGAGAGGEGDWALRDSDLAWSGSASMRWPLLAPIEALDLVGTVDSQTLRLVYQPQNAALDATIQGQSEGLHWDGSLGWDAGVRADGSLSVRGVAIEAPAGLVIRMAGLRAQARLRESTRFRLSRLRTSSLTARWPQASGYAEARFDDVRVPHATGDRENFELDNVQAAEATIATNLEGVGDWTLLEPELSSVRGGPGRPMTARRARSALVRGGPDGGLQLLDFVLDDLERDRHGVLRARAASTKSLRWRNDPVETQGTGLAGEHLEIAQGELALGRLVISRLSRHVGAQLEWVAASLVAEPLQMRLDESTEIGQLAVESIALYLDDGGTWEVSRAGASGLAVGPDGAGEADSTGAERLWGQEPTGGQWTVLETAAEHARWHPDGSLDASALVARQVRHHSADEDEWVLSEVSTVAPELGQAGELRVGQLAATRVSLAPGQGQGSFEADDVEAVDLYRPGAGVAAAGRLTMQALRYQRGAGLRWQAAPLEVSNVSRSVGGSLSADTVAAAVFSLDLASGAKWRLEGAHAAAFALESHGVLQADPLVLERLAWETDSGDRASASGVRVERLEWSAADGGWPNARHARALSLAGATDQATWAMVEARLDGVTARPGEPVRADTLAVAAGEIEADRHRMDWGALLARGVSVSDAARIDVERLDVERPSLTGVAGEGISSQAARVHDLSWAPRELAATSVELERARVEFGIDATGAWILPHWPRADVDAGSRALRIGALETVEGDNRAWFFDRSIEPANRIAFAPFQVAIQGLDTSDSANAADFELRSRVEDFASLEAGGRLFPRVDGFDVEARGRLSGWPLAELSGYATRYLDTAIEAGHGDLDFEGTLTDGLLHGEGDLVLTQVRALPASSGPSALPADDAARTQSGDKQIGDRGDAASSANPGLVSFAAALALLADQDGTVRLRVPVSGPIGDPEFDFSDATGQAIFRTVQSALTIPLQPVGLLLSARGLLRGLQLESQESIEFELGVAHTSAEGLARLDGLAESLTERPRERLALCGKAVPADIARLEGSGAQDGDTSAPTLLEGVGAEPSSGAWSLALDRAEFARRYLTEKHAIDPLRLVDCPAEVDPDADALPRIEVQRILDEG